MHTLEVYGAEGCCDGTTKWSFSVNDGDWLDFTVINLNRFLVTKTKTTLSNNTICNGMKGYAKLCPNASGYHYTINRTKFDE